MDTLSFVLGLGKDEGGGGGGDFAGGPDEILDEGFGEYDGGGGGGDFVKGLGDTEGFREGATAEVVEDDDLRLNNPGLEVGSPYGVRAAFPSLKILISVSTRCRTGSYRETHSSTTFSVSARP